MLVRGAADQLQYGVAIGVMRLNNPNNSGCDYAWPWVLWERKRTAEAPDDRCMLDAWDSARARYDKRQNPLRRPLEIEEDLLMDQWYTIPHAGPHACTRTRTGPVVHPRQTLLVLALSAGGEALEPPRPGRGP